MNLHPKIKPTLDLILNLFKSGNVPKAVAIATFPPFEVPSNTWSLANRIIMAIHGTSDARGYKQWMECNRYVKKGSKAFHILAPWLINKSGNNTCEPDDETGPVHVSKLLRGFLAVPVFKVEDTDGEDLDYEKLELPDIPLLDVAKAWAIDVAPVSYQGSWLGYYLPDADKIRLATPAEKTFFHELSHVAHYKVKGKLRNGQDWRQEIVAELSAQVLCHIVGIEPGQTLGNSYQYICSYASAVRMEPANACLAVLSDIEKVLNLILSESAALKTVEDVPAL
jgi:antirestriction protein ArdC